MGLNVIAIDSLYLPDDIKKIAVAFKSLKPLLNTQKLYSQLIKQAKRAKRQLSNNFKKMICVVLVHYINSRYIQYVNANQYQRFKYVLDALTYFINIKIIIMLNKQTFITNLRHLTVMLSLCQMSFLLHVRGIKKYFLSFYRYGIYVYIIQYLLPATSLAPFRARG